MTPDQPDQARPAEAHDVGVLSALMVEFYAESEYSLDRAVAERTFTALLNAPQMGQVWLLEAGGSPAGFIVLTVSFSMEYGGLRGFVDDFFVRKPFRRRGLGTLALQAVRDECVLRGVKALLVETASANAEAVSVYRRAGFVETGHLFMKNVLGEPVHELPINETSVPEA